MPPFCPHRWQTTGRLTWVGWSPGNHNDYNREFCFELVKIRAFLSTTQPEAATALRLSEDGPTRRKFLVHLQKEIFWRGTIDVLRNAGEGNR